MMTLIFNKLAIKINRDFFSILFLLLILISCDKKKDDKTESLVTMTKQARLDSLLISPIIINSNLKKENIDNIDFYKSYLLAENTHTQYYLDSIIRYSSLGEDVIELLKNKHQEKILFLRFKSEKLHLRYGVYIGMSLDDFLSKMPAQEMIDNTIIYDDENVSIEFFFDIKTNKLKSVFYYCLLD